MAPTTLYNKWRPRTFADPRDRPIIGQDPVGRTLRQAILRQQVAHAYLFCGPRGTGKTSAARIFARAVNCLAGLQGEPCNRCANCVAMLDGRQLDLLVEIDAASNRGVEDARTLRDRLLQRPGGDGLTGRYKVYIIDEVHMLTREAFNTLLKSLEEPPPHVLFILATTDPQEVLPTIASRCQRFDFRSIPLEQLVAHLAHVATEEGVEVETRALETLARAARGGLRDAIGLLDQAFAYAGTGGPDGARRVAAAQVDAMLGLSRTDAVSEVVRAIGDADLAAMLRATHAALEEGADVRAFARQVVEALRAILLMVGGAPDAGDLDPALKEVAALHARRFTLGRVIRAIKAVTGLDAGLRTRVADAALLFEVAVAEVIVDAAASQSGVPVAAPTVLPVRVAPPPRPTPVTPPAADAVRADVPLVPPPPTPSDPLPEATGAAPHVDVREVPEVPEAVVGNGGQADSREPTAEPGEGAAGAAAAPAPSTGTWPTPAGRASAPREVGRRRGAASATFEEVAANWSAVIDRVGADGMAPLVGLLQGSMPSGIDADGVVGVACGSTFFVQKLKEPANQVGIERCASRVLGAPVRLRFHVVGTPAETVTRRSAPAGVQDAFVARATRMLGGRALSPEEVESLDRQATLPLEGLPD